MSDDLDDFIKVHTEEDPEFRAEWDLTQIAAEIGTRLKGLRSRKGLSITELSTLTGLAASYLEDFELGLETDITIDSLFRIACALGAKVAVHFEVDP